MICEKYLREQSFSFGTETLKGKIGNKYLANELPYRDDSMCNCLKKIKKFN